MNQRAEDAFRADIVEVGRRMYARAYVASNDGNISIRLDDGRRLGYAEYGDPGGAPVIFFNGAPATRIQGAMVAEVAKRFKVRLICPQGSMSKPCQPVNHENRHR